ncbi:hypothetical protein F8M41_011293 [Gigaspora margarita]|uniref:RING-type domain-containing protein n=1 Tax=Gigaspora margarita TaxID=4874 RepID=A0A8H4A1T1_GIGMA|nr:hypothetical protein F8M41_011293 [Gigaspora margarita]
MFLKEEAYTERLENYCKRYEDNNLYSSLEELYELYYHIAKEENHESGVEVPELDSCSICNEEIFLHILKKSFTVLTCDHTVHRLCIENLRETMFTCPVNNCSTEIKIIEKLPLMRALSQRSMSIDEGSQDSLIFSKNSLDTIVEENSESCIPDSTASNLPSKGSAIYQVIRAY